MSLSPSTSPPRTPEDNRISSNNSSKSTTPNSDDSSIIDDLSFDYIVDQEGNFVRLSKSSSKSNHSSPPTPQESSLQPDPPLKPPSPDLLNSPMTRISLSRSESAFPILSSGSSTAAQNDKPARSFQRVLSGPAITMSASASYLAPTNSSLSKPRVAPRRIALEDSRERHEANSLSRTRQTIDSNIHSHTLLQEEKENISESDDHPQIKTAMAAIKQRSSPPLATRLVSSSSTRVPATRAAYLANGASSASGRPLTDIQRASHSRQIMPGPNRAGRIMKSTSASKYSSSAAIAPSFDRIAERETSDSEQAGDYYSPVRLTLNGEDTDREDDPVAAVEPAAVPLPSSVPSSGSHLSVGRQRGQSILSVNVNVGLSAGSAALSQSGNSRPRRSASLSDALSMFFVFFAN